MDPDILINRLEIIITTFELESKGGQIPVFALADLVSLQRDLIKEQLKLL